MTRPEADAVLAEAARLRESATPGPWRANTSDVYSDSDGAVIGDIVCAWPRAHYEESLKYWPANAAYIAACPELAAIAESLSKELERVRANCTCRFEDLDSDCVVHGKRCGKPATSDDLAHVHADIHGMAIDVSDKLDKLLARTSRPDAEDAERYRFLVGYYLDHGAFPAYPMIGLDWDMHRLDAALDAAIAAAEVRP